MTNILIYGEDLSITVYLCTRRVFAALLFLSTRQIHQIIELVLQYLDDYYLDNL